MQEDTTQPCSAEVPHTSMIMQIDARRIISEKPRASTVARYDMHNDLGTVSVQLFPNATNDSISAAMEAAREAFRRLAPLNRRNLAASHSPASTTGGQKITSDLFTLGPAIKLTINLQHGKALVDNIADGSNLVVSGITILGSSGSMPYFRDEKNIPLHGTGTTSSVDFEISPVRAYAATEYGGHIFVEIMIRAVEGRGTRPFVVAKEEEWSLEARTAQLRKTNDYPTDLDLKTADGSFALGVHGFFFASLSDECAAHLNLKGNFGNGIRKEVVVDGIDSKDALMLFASCVYGQMPSCDDVKKHAVPLLCAASHFGLPRLSSLCMTSLTQSAREEGSLETLVEAYLLLKRQIILPKDRAETTASSLLLVILAKLDDIVGHDRWAEWLREGLGTELVANQLWADKRAEVDTSGTRIEKLVEAWAVLRGERSTADEAAEFLEKLRVAGKSLAAHDKFKEWQEKHKITEAVLGVAAAQFKRPRTAV